MIDLYTWPTPNGHKVQIMLEECGLTYKVIPININKGDQFQPEFLQISPNMQRWLDEIGARPAVVKGLEVLAEHRRIRGATIDEETRRNMFGEAQYQKR